MFQQYPMIQPIIKSFHTHLNHLEVFVRKTRINDSKNKESCYKEQIDCDVFQSLQTIYSSFLYHCSTLDPFRKDASDTIRAH